LVEEGVIERKMLLMKWMKRVCICKVSDGVDDSPLEGDLMRGEEMVDWVVGMT